MKTILLTGATSVLARKFITRYASEYNIISGVRNVTSACETKFESWDAIDSSLKCDLVLNFAGKYSVDDSLNSKKQVMDAVIGTANSISAYCIETKTPLVTLGSYFEKAPIEFYPWSYYAIAKVSAYELFKLASETYDIPMRYVYCYDTYGADLTRGKIVDILLDSLTTDLELSPGEQILNLTHEDDFVSGIKTVLEELLKSNKGFESYQIRNPKDEYSLREVVEIINSKRDKKVNIKFGAKPYRKKEVFKVWDCAPALLDWEPKIQFDKFVAEYMAK